MIKQAELNSVITDIQNYQIAYNAFLSRYNEVPGDMINAESYWPSPDGCSQTAGYCTGNGDGSIAFYNMLNNESLLAWRELSLAGMINSNINIVNYHGFPNPNPFVVGVNVPPSKIGDAGYLMITSNISSSGDVGYLGWSSGWALFWYEVPTNLIVVAKPTPAGPPFYASWGLAGGALSGDDVFQIDQKIDDGKIDGAGSFFGSGTGKTRMIGAADLGSVCSIGSPLRGCILGSALEDK